MSNTNLVNPHRRKPSTAVLLSLLLTGLGHVYCGQIVWGLVLAFVSGTLAVAIMAALFVTEAPVRIAASFALVVASLVIGLSAVVHSYYVARRTRSDYQLKDYNRWYVYLIILLMTTGGAVGLSLNVRGQLIGPFHYGGSAMIPTLMPNDRVLANKVAYDRTDPRRGDVVVFHNPEGRHKAARIARVVAVEGDTVEFRANQLYVNGQKLLREPISKPSPDPAVTLDQQNVYHETNGQAKYTIIVPTDDSTERPIADSNSITVPRRNCFVLGDNRRVEQDSRQFGPIHIGGIIGRVDYLYLPAQDWSRFGRVQN
jgi:signal peptidase I